MLTSRPTKRLDRLLCALAILCFMVQQLWSPLHCVLHEHQIGDSGLARSGVENCPTHAGHDHFHGDEKVEAGHEDPDHEPHPIEDELTRLVEKLAPRSSGGQRYSQIVCLEVGSAFASQVTLPFVGSAWYEIQFAHGPPDSWSPAPRGPPVMV
jgi:hypothetical protein